MVRTDRTVAVSKSGQRPRKIPNRNNDRRFARVYSITQTYFVAASSDSSEHGTSTGSTRALTRSLILVMHSAEESFREQVKY